MPFIATFNEPDVAININEQCKSLFFVALILINYVSVFLHNSYIHTITFFEKKVDILH